MTLHMRPKEGFRYTEEALEEFFDDMKDAWQALSASRVEGRPPAEKLQQVIGEQARSNGPLQAFLAIQCAQAIQRP